MKTFLLLNLFTVFLYVTINAQVKIASYSVGKYGTETYEHISFWSENGQRTNIEYSYGSKPKEMKLVFLGKTINKGQKAIKVQFPNKYVLYIIPSELRLNVTDRDGKYYKTFNWEYEGPVNGIGTHCNICAEDEEDAMELFKENYLN